MTLLFREPRIEDKPHLRFIGTLPCLLCGNDIETQAAHIRFPDLRAAKRPTGMGEKSHDFFVIPLCGEHHSDQHAMSERAFWDRAGIDPVFVALALYAHTGNHAAGCQIVGHARQS